MSAIQKAKSHRAELLRELARTDRFIADYAGFENSEAPSESGRTFIPGQKDEVLGQIIAVLKQSQTPVRNNEITRRIEQNGFKIVAQSPASYVAIVIHRNQDKFERTKEGTRLREASGTSSKGAA